MEQAVEERIVDPIPPIPCPAVVLIESLRLIFDQAKFMIA